MKKPRRWTNCGFWHGYSWDEEMPTHLRWTVRYYTRNYSERLRGVIDRISYNKPLRNDEIQKIAFQWANRHVHRNGMHTIIRNAVPDSCYYLGIVNGQSVRIDYFEGIKIKTEKTIGNCRWCKIPIFKTGKRVTVTCRKRTCRELQAVYAGKHQVIRMRTNFNFSNTPLNELKQLEFIAKFYERKSKWIISQAKSKGRVVV